MKHTALRLLTLAAAGLLPTLASAHPGHFALDPLTAPHTGHEGEIALLLFAALAVAGLAVHRRIRQRR